MYFLKKTMIFNRLQYNVNITFICTGKPKNSCDILFIAIFSLFWNSTHNISEDACNLLIKQSNPFYVGGDHIKVSILEGRDLGANLDSGFHNLKPIRYA